MALLALLALLALFGCGGGGGGEPQVPPPVDVKWTEVMEDANTLLIPGIHGFYDLSVGGTRVSEVVNAPLSCDGAGCANEGEPLAVSAIFDDELEVLETGRRGSFQTMTATQGDERDALNPGIIDVAPTTLPDLRAYGLWGNHGFAAVMLAHGPVADTTDGVELTGRISFALPVALGDSPGSSPSGMGGATWRGIASAVSLTTYEVEDGTSVITIPDLASPRVNVDVLIDSQSVAKPSWRGLALTGGRYAAGTFGEDRLDGIFAGPAHQETYGVFGTDAYVGAFGAKRQ
ncbi:MAG: hypothetical protein OXF11_06905 [Deltaproteobacteria bacterium]|nr:hypothetical protein [Deltaproteobacteria bacterium]